MGIFPRPPRPSRIFSKVSPGISDSPLVIKGHKEEAIPMPEKNNKNKKLPAHIRLIDQTEPTAPVSPETPWDATELAKAATDVIALNRHMTAPSVRVSEDSHSGPRVASLGSLRCGLKIRKEPSPAPESVNDVRSLVKE